MLRISKDQVWEYFVGDQTKTEFLRLIDEEVESGKYKDRATAFINYCDFALSNTQVEDHLQQQNFGGWDVKSLAAELQRQCEKEVTST